MGSSIDSDLVRSMVEKLNRLDFMKGVPLRACPEPLHIVDKIHFFDKNIKRKVENVITRFPKDLLEGEVAHTSVEIVIKGPRDLLQACVDAGLVELALKRGATLMGRLSPLTPLRKVGMSSELRNNLGVPSQACYFSFVYPCDQLMRGGDSGTRIELPKVTLEPLHALISFGGMVFFDINGLAIKYLCISQDQNHENRRKMRIPLKMSCNRVDSKFTQALWENKRFCSVTVTTLVELGVTNFAWVCPSEHEQARPYGGFVYTTGTSKDHFEPTTFLLTWCEPDDTDINNMQDYEVDEKGTVIKDFTRDRHERFLQIVKHGTREQVLAFMDAVQKWANKRLQREHAVQEKVKHGMGWLKERAQWQKNAKQAHGDDLAESKAARLVPIVYDWRQRSKTEPTTKAAQPAEGQAGEDNIETTVREMDEIVWELLNHKDSEGLTPLWHALEHGNRPVVKLLIDKGVDLRTRFIKPSPRLQISRLDKHEGTVMQLAVREKCYDMARLLIARCWSYTDPETSKRAGRALDDMCEQAIQSQTYVLHEEEHCLLSSLLVLCWMRNDEPAGRAHFLMLQHAIHFCSKIQAQINGAEDEDDSLEEDLERYKREVELTAVALLSNSLRVGGDVTQKKKAPAQQKVSSGALPLAWRHDGGALFEEALTAECYHLFADNYVQNFFLKKWRGHLIYQLCSGQLRHGDVVTPMRPASRFWSWALTFLVFIPLNVLIAPVVALCDDLDETKGDDGRFAKALLKKLEARGFSATLQIEWKYTYLLSAPLFKFWLWYASQLTLGLLITSLAPPAVEMRAAIAMADVDAEEKRRRWQQLYEQVGFTLGGPFSTPLLWVWLLAVLVGQWKSYTRNSLLWWLDGINYLELMGQLGCFAAISCYELQNLFQIASSLQAIEEIEEHADIFLEIMLSFGLLFMWLGMSFRMMALLPWQMGQLVVMFGFMCKDVFRWALVSLALMVSFAAAFVTVFKTRDNVLDACAEDGAWERTLGGSGLLASMGVLLKIGLSAANPPLDCLSGSFPASLLMIIYMVLMVILLVNMLIAMMTRSFDAVQGRGASVAKYIFSWNVLQWRLKEALPPPFSLFTRLSALWRCCHSGLDESARGGASSYGKLGNGGERKDEPKVITRTYTLVDFQTLLECVNSYLVKHNQDEERLFRDRVQKDLSTQQHFRDQERDFINNQGEHHTQLREEVQTLTGKLAEAQAAFRTEQAAFHKEQRAFVKEQADFRQTLMASLKEQQQALPTTRALPLGGEEAPPGKEAPPGEAAAASRSMVAATDAIVAANPVAAGGGELALRELCDAATAQLTAATAEITAATAEITDVVHAAAGELGQALPISLPERLSEALDQRLSELLRQQTAELLEPIEQHLGHVRLEQQQQHEEQLQKSAKLFEPIEQQLAHVRQEQQQQQEEELQWRAQQAQEGQQRQAEQQRWAEEQRQAEAQRHAEQQRWAEEQAEQRLAERQAAEQRQATQEPAPMLSLEQQEQQLEQLRSVVAAALRVRDASLQESLMARVGAASESQSVQLQQMRQGLLEALHTEVQQALGEWGLAGARSQLDSLQKLESVQTRCEQTGEQQKAMGALLERLSRQLEALARQLQRETPSQPPPSDAGALLSLGLAPQLSAMRSSASSASSAHSLPAAAPLPAPPLPRAPVFDRPRYEAPASSTLGAAFKGKSRASPCASALNPVSLGASTYASAYDDAFRTAMAAELGEGEGQGAAGRTKGSTRP